MTLRGTIRNGHIELDRATDLPDGTRVTIAASVAKDLLRAAKRRPRPRPSKKDPAFRIAELAVPMGIRDLAEQHDHYLYGTPKRSVARPKKAAKPSRKSKR